MPVVVHPWGNAIITICAWCGKTIRRGYQPARYEFSHGICAACKKVVLADYYLSSASRNAGASMDRKNRAVNLPEFINTIDEQLVSEQVGLEKDFADLIKRIRYIENKQQRLVFTRAARLAMSLLIRNRPGELTASLPRTGMRQL